MPDLFTWLTARYIEEHSAGASPATSDAALQWMELQLEASHETAADERYLLEQYLGFKNDELQALPVPVHEWFLERWALAGPGTDDSERVSQLADRIAVMYLMAGPGTYQAAAVAALLAFDQQWERGPSHVTRIWDLITTSMPAEARASALAPLVEALLDLVYLTAEPALVLRALGDVARRDAHTGYALPLMRDRVVLVGEGGEGPVARLLAELEG
jgi:hypothetical protein